MAKIITLSEIFIIVVVERLLKLNQNVGRHSEIIFSNDTLLSQQKSPKESSSWNDLGKEGPIQQLT